MAECGITLHLMHGSGTPEATVKMLDAAEQCGIRVLVNDHRVWSDPEGLAASFSNHKALYGYHITDEPTAADFPKLAKAMAGIRKADPNHPAYINLFPSFARGLGTKTYDEYVRRFVKEVQPPFLSYDQYPIVAKGKEGRESPSLRPFFYDNIEQCRRIAQENNLDLWAFCLTTPHYWPAKGTGYPPPTEGHLRLQIYTDLAYGARAVQYFTYWTPGKGAEAGIVYYDGPIDADGKRTKTFDLLKPINAEIKKLAPLLLSLRVTAVAHADPLPQGTKGLSAEIPLTAIKGDCCVSLATRKGERYLWVVSRSFDREQNVTLTLGNGIERLEEVDRGNGETLKLTPTEATRDIVVPLAPGDGRLFRIIGR
ncbi:MAG: hypothetical protein A2Z34_07215 [Planctomycetes bacterium RBG_16_59_8]|nr:MAG: hypothetical protein A2Z34_07215 [Planctomycetes bacterium RBG_16_59_8]